MKHAVAPWTWTLGRYGFRLVGPDGIPVLAASVGGLGIIARSSADADLVAAAPRLIAALRMQIDECERCKRRKHTCPMCEDHESIVRPIEEADDAAR